MADVENDDVDLVTFKEWYCGCKLQKVPDDRRGTSDMFWSEETPYYLNCEMHVACDERCMSLKNPRTCAEYKQAYEHWKNHSRLGGCSHGE